MLYLIWAGLILGVSFIATPVKFQAPNLTMPVALEVGKATFHLFNPIEWVIIIAIIILTGIAPNLSQKWDLIFLLLPLLLAQTFWLLPALDIRADAVIAGTPPNPNHLHWIYIIMELSKLLITLIVPWQILKRGLHG